MMQLLAQGWGPVKVRERYLRYAHPLVEAGVTFEPIDKHNRPGVRDLISAQVLGMTPGWQIGKDDGGLVARDAGGQMIGALLLGAATFEQPRPGYVVASIRAAAVDPSWRGRGVGVVLMGMADRAYAPLVPSFYMGNCAQADARFYQKLGYTVLMPGELYPFPFGNYGSFRINNPEYPCFFYRHG